MPLKRRALRRQTSHYNTFSSSSIIRSLFITLYSTRSLFLPFLFYLLSLRPLCVYVSKYLESVLLALMLLFLPRNSHEFRAAYNVIILCYCAMINSCPLIKVTRMPGEFEKNDHEIILPTKSNVISTLSSFCLLIPLCPKDFIIT